MTETAKAAATATATQLSKSAPHLVLILLVLGVVSYSQERERKSWFDGLEDRDSRWQEAFEARSIRQEAIAERNEQMAAMRIEHCHGVQDRGIAAMQSLSTSLAMQESSYQELSLRMDSVIQELRLAVDLLTQRK